MLDRDEEVLDQEQGASCGIVMIDEEYYFKIQARQYIFGKMRTVQDEESKNYGKPIYNDMLFPGDIEGVFKLYFRHKLADLSAGKRLSIKELLDLVNEVKLLILNISKQLQMEV